MNCDLDSLLLDLSGLDDAGVERVGREEYCRACIDAQGMGIRLTHDGMSVEFRGTRFDHAFFSPRDSRFSDEKAVIDARRVRRIRWICEIIAGRAPNSDCWEVTENLRKRFYRVVGKGYIIWLEQYEADCWTFSTAYLAAIPYLHKQTRVKGARRIWKYGQKNAP
jgi:hypothetical protein